MGKLCTDFANSQDETKFELCDTIRTILRSYPKSNFDEDDCEWLPMLQQGLHDILFSRLGKSQRDPAMMLVASVIEVSDFNWCLNASENRLITDHICKFLQIKRYSKCIFNRSLVSVFYSI